jgi:hypothetical protein
MYAGQSESIIAGGLRSSAERPALSGLPKVPCLQYDVGRRKRSFTVDRAFSCITATSQHKCAKNSRIGACD